MKLLLAALSCLVPLSALAETISWDPPTKHEDGTDLAPGELREFRIYDQRKLVKVVPAPTTSAPIFPGTSAHVWEATAVDQKGNQSKYSNAVQWYPTPVPTLQWPPAEPSTLRLK